MTDMHHEVTGLPRVAAMDAVLAPGATITLSEGQVHHLRQVLRLGDGGQLRVFNATQGEWLAIARFAGKKGMTVEVTTFLRPPLVLPDVWLLAPPLKKDALDFMIEKASELGVQRFVPVITDHSAVHRFNDERAAAQARDAAEQCERSDIMDIAPLRSLADVLAQWPEERMLYLALERSAAPPMLSVLNDEKPTGKSAVLIGPEGGFSDAERKHLQTLPFVRAVSLGPTVLRAETAAIVALAILAAV